VRERAGSVRSWSIPGDQFQTADGKWVLIIALNPQTGMRLMEAMGRPELYEDPRFNDRASRLANVDELHAIIGEWVGGFDSADLYARLDEHRVPYGPIHSIADIFEDPHYKAREDLVVVDDPQIGPTVVPNVYPKLSHASGRVYSPAPVPGQHNEEIYGALGLDEAELKRLREADVI
jgi:formyl-CoA transferase